MLELAGVMVDYGAAPALRSVTLSVQPGELVCVVGPNGAGKTTLINTIAGVLRAREGSLHLNGRDITRLASHKFCAAGIAIVPEGRHLFTGMSVLDNLVLGSFTPHAKRRRAQSLAQVLVLFPMLEGKLRDAAGSLSGGQQQMVAIARALMACPTLLLLDEPSLGLAPLIVHDMFRAIRAINALGTSVLLVEQNVAMAMQLAKRAYVMEEGRIVAEGLASELMDRPEIRKAYLGLDTQI
ncbi:MAG: ABC transporter ATP-binding protein [Burkholderiaceae bacterium]